MKSTPSAGRRKIIYLGLDDTIDQDARVELLALLREYTDLVELTADNNAFLDITYNAFDIPFGTRVAKMIKGDIKRQLGLTISLGLGPSKFIASIAMASARPDGLTIVRPEQVADFLADAPLDLIPGVGATTCQRLAAMGVANIGQLPERAELARQFGQRGYRLWALAQGLDGDLVASAEQPNRIGEEKTFGSPVYDREEMQDAVRAMATALSGRLRRRKLRGQLVSIEVLYPDIVEETRSIQLSDYADAAQTLMTTGMKLLRRTEVSTRGVRRLVLSLSGFSGQATEQLDLFRQAASCGKTESP